MRARRFELRLLAIALTVAWAAAAAVVLIAYRPGGPLDLLVGLAMLVPIGIALAAVRWPPMARGAGAFPAMVILGVVALLLLLPSIGGVVEQILALGSQTLMPSLEAAYPWAVALAGTSLFAAFGQTRRLDRGEALRPRRLLVGALLGLGMTAGAGGAFAAVTIANEIAIREGGVLPTRSRFGPVTGEDPPACDGPLDVGSTARVRLRVAGEVDLRPVGSVDVTGFRAGDEFRWLAYVASSQELGLFGQSWVDGQAFVRSPSSDWRSTGQAVVAEGALDRRVWSTALTEDYRATAEDRGEEVLEGARARRCRVSVDGAVFIDAFPQARWLIGDADISRWRGELDYWIFLDGQLGQVAGSANGEAIEISPRSLLGTITVHLTATERGRETFIYPPSP